VIGSASHRLLFVHVQKTGGLTVEAMLTKAIPDAEPIRVPGGRHAHYADALAARPDLADRWSFGFVRNPWARMYSWHAMVLRRKAAAESGNETMARRMKKMEFWHRVGTEFPEFEDFVLRGPDEIDRLRTPQLDYLRAGDREVDFIGRTESLDDDIATVFAHVGLPAPEAERRNAGPPTDYRQHYTDAMRDRVAEIFASDIERFDYRF
jgi:hypothetical protein